MRRAAVFLQRHAGRLILPALLLVLWLLIESAALPAGVDASTSERTADLIRQTSAQSIQSGDAVLLSTADDSLRQSVDSTGASVWEFDPAGPAGFQTSLTGLLADYCGRDSSQPAYLVWTGDAAAMGPAMRAVNFFFTFQTVLPYKGYNVYAVDNILRLEPKWEAIARYCDALALAGGRDVVAILSPGDFSPWIGSVQTGNVTWLAADPSRTVVLSDFTVGGLPPVSTYDAYWMGITETGFTWPYNNSDAEAYREVFSRPGVKDALLLAGNAAVIGPVAEGYVRECEGNFFGGLFFRRICLSSGY